MRGCADNALPFTSEREHEAALGRQGSALIISGYSSGDKAGLGKSAGCSAGFYTADRLCRHCTG